MAYDKMLAAALDVLAPADCFCVPENECWYECMESARSRQTDSAQVIIATLRPLIEADLRERLAAAIEAIAACYDEPGATIGEESYAQGLTAAARIVRETP